MRWSMTGTGTLCLEQLTMRETDKLWPITKPSPSKPKAMARERFPNDT